MDFLILSLPRSGTAWFANFLTYGNCFCYHEPLADGHLNQPRVAPITGAIDTIAYLGEWSAPRMYALVRNSDEIEASLSKLSPITFRDDYDRFYSRTFDLVTFRYDSLFNLDYLELVWNTITNSPFPHARAELLIEMNIQRDFDKLVRRVGRAYGGA